VSLLRQKVKVGMLVVTNAETGMIQTCLLISFFVIKASLKKEVDDVTYTIILR